MYCLVVDLIFRQFSNATAACYRNIHIINDLKIAEYHL